MAYFSEKELACSCCGKNLIKPDFLYKLNALREECGFPFVVTSAYRCFKHNTDVGGKDRSPHPLGRGIDIHAIGAQALKIVELAPKHGFTGIGVSQKGPSKGRFIHLDDMPNELDRSRPWIWSY